MEVLGFRTSSLLSGIHTPFLTVQPPTPKINILPSWKYIHSTLTPPKVLTIPALTLSHLSEMYVHEHTRVHTYTHKWRGRKQENRYQLVRKMLSREQNGLWHMADTVIDHYIQNGKAEQRLKVKGELWNCYLKFWKIAKGRHSSNREILFESTYKCIFALQMFVIFLSKKYRGRGFENQVQMREMSAM